MMKMYPGRHILVATSLLAVAMLAVADLSNIRHWVQTVLVCLAYLFCCSFSQSDTRNSRWSSGLLLAAAVVMALAWILLNRITALYLSGGLLLGIVLLGNLTDLGLSRIRFRDIAVPALLVAAALAISEITVSRIAINLSSLPVPSKFQLHSDAAADRQHHSSRGYPLHDLNPLTVQLGANHLPLNEPMPWLEFEARRDTIFPIVSVQYRFFNIVIHEIRAADLHQLQLSDRSDAVTLDKVEEGITINNIGANESAWLKLPGLQDLDPGFEIVSKIALYRLFLWFLVCLAFFCWQPLLPAAARRQ